MTRIRIWALVLVGMLVAAPAMAQVSETITIDGTNDFDPSNLIDDDSGDTEITNWCTDDPEDDAPMDLKEIYVTNDTNFLYIGFGYDPECFSSPQVNLGVAIDVNTAAGGATDPFNRKIAWNTVSNKPDFVVYDVIDGFNYEVLYQWNGGTMAWDVVTAGSNGLGIAGESPTTGFVELRLSLATLGLAPGSNIGVELWMTQDGTTKPPLDACFSDGAQTSTPAGTVFDLGGGDPPVEMLGYHPFTVLSSTDVIPPVVEEIEAVGFTVDGNGQISTTTSSVDVQFSEPVGAGANVTSNYSLSNFAGSITAAFVDGGDPSLVHLFLSTPIGPSNNFYELTVQNVQDIAGNPVTANGVDNVAAAFLKKVRFEGDMSVFLLTNSTPPDEFAIEGSLSPLTFTPQDNAKLLDGDMDDIYVTEVPFSIARNKGTGVAEALLEWKFHHNTEGFEPRSNRQHTLSDAGGSMDLLQFFWNDDDPSAVTDKAIDVIFRVDMSMVVPMPTLADTVSVTGDQSPLPNFGAPGIIMTDDGVAPDDVAGDKIYAVRATFPLGTFKTVQFKFLLNSEFECTGQGNREVFLNDTIFSTSNPIDLPARKWDRCTVTDKAVAVTFRVDSRYHSPLGVPVSDVQVGGNNAQLGDFDAMLAQQMADDGAPPDDTADDDVFSVTVVFPDSTNRFLEYKYTIDDEFECLGFGNRTLTIDDVNHDAGNPQLPPIGIWNYCTDITTGIGDNLPGPVTLHLSQNFPNPFRGAKTTIEFEAERRTSAELRVFDVAGRLVRTLFAGTAAEGLNLVDWDGLDDRGREVKPGIYFYTLSMDNETATRRMVLMK